MKKQNHSLKSYMSQSKESSRIYLRSMHPDDFPEIIPYMDESAQTNNFTKLFAKVPARYGPHFINAGYRIEAYIPYFYNGKEDALFLMKYFSDERKKPETAELEAFQSILIVPRIENPARLPDGYDLRPLDETHINPIVAVFKQVFKTYPFPIYDPEFILKTMHEHGTRYFGVFHQQTLIAVSSAECSDKGKNAEMTDFAVIPPHRGKRLATCLLAFMEKELANIGYKTFYSIARLHSIPMNKTFYNMGYKYSGTLTKNTQISGQIESMNVWYKNL